MAKERVTTYRNTSSDPNSPVWEKYYCKTVADAVMMSDSDDETKNVLNEVQIDETSFENEIAGIIGETGQAIENGFVYSTVPTKIGTWIDGTPIWRVAFDIPTDEVGDGFLIEDKAVGISDLGFDKFLNDVVNIAIINASCVAQNTSEKNITDDCHGVLNIGSFDFVSLNPNFVGFYGYVEFATPETNIKK